LNSYLYNNLQEILTFESAFNDGAFILMSEWESVEAWLEPLYIVESEEFLAIQEMSQMECLNGLYGFEGRGIDIVDLPGGDDVVEVAIKRVTNEEDFEDSLEAFRSAYLTDAASIQADFESAIVRDLFRVNMNVFDDLETASDVARDIRANPDAAVEHFDDFVMRCHYLARKFE